MNNPLGYSSPGLKASLTIRCWGPDYNPCGREETISISAAPLEISAVPLSCLPSQWCWVDSKIMCDNCALIYLKARRGEV